MMLQPYLKISINLNISYLLLTVVICHLSFNITGSTLLAPCSSLVQPVDVTNLIPVQSQFRISSGKISSISNVALNSSKIFSSFLQNFSQNICSLLFFPSSVHTIYEKLSAGEFFCGVHGFLLDHESFPMNQALINQQCKSTELLQQNFYCKYVAIFPMKT